MIQKQIIIGVMGGAKCSPAFAEQAFQLGSKIAEEGWVLLNGGRDAGIMAATAKGAFEAGGLTVGVLPGDTHEGCSPHIRIPIVTGMGNARNLINILSSDVIIACPGGAGTISEIALAIKTETPVVFFGWDKNLPHFFKVKNNSKNTTTVDETISSVKAILGEQL